MNDMKKPVGRPKSYTEDDKQKVLALSEVLGTTAASSITGIPIATVFRMAAGAPKATPNQLADFLGFVFKGRESELLGEVARYQLQ